MAIFCTYCSAEKETDEYLLPAIQRYFSERILRISQAAAKVGTGFFILSGEFGLLEPKELIPYYDHLLVADQIEAMAFKLADQI